MTDMDYMKILSLILIFLYASTSFADESIDFLRNKISANPDKFFYDGVQFSKVADLPDGSKSFSLEKKGINLAGGFLVNVFGQFVHLYSLYDPEYKFNNFTLTFKFHSPNGASHSFNCHAIDNYNCGTIEMVNCSKSRYGYSILLPERHTFTYNEEKHEKCTRNDVSINQSQEVKSIENSNDTSKTKQASAVTEE